MRITYKSGAALAAAGIFVMLSGAGYAQNEANANGITPGQTSSKAMNSTDQRFATGAAQGGLAEVELGHLALEKAKSEDVKQFGQRMIDDHNKANEQLKAIAAKDNIQLPTSIDAKDQALKDKLSNLSGTQFDRAYIRDMVKDHEHDIAEFQKEASNGQNPDLKAFAAQTLPTLQEHLRLAKDAEAKLKTNP